MFDKGCGTHICKNMQGFRKRRNLKEAKWINSLATRQMHIGIYELKFPNEIILILNDCHYAPRISVGIVLVSLLINSCYKPMFFYISILVYKTICYVSILFLELVFMNLKGKIRPQ